MDSNRKQQGTSTAVSYIRFSSKKQASGASLRRQLEATRAYCEQEGLQLDESLDLRDLGVSAWSGANAEHGALAGFLELVREGRITCGTRLIVESIDRISRQDPIDAFEIMLSLLRAGVHIVTLMDRQVYDATALRDGRAHVLLALMQRAHEESQTKSRRVRDALDRKKKAIIEERKPATANGPAWLRLSEDRSRYEPIPEKVEVARRVLQLVRDGMGLASVAKKLNADGVPPLHKRGKRWHQSYVTRLIANRQLIGEYQPHVGHGKERRPAGDPIKGYYPPIVEKSLFYSAQKAQQKRSTKPGRTGSRVNLFSGLVVDTKGSTWVATHKGPRDKHRLVSGAARAGVPGHTYQSIPLASFENALMLMIRELWERRPGPAADTKRIEELLGEVADVDAKIGSLKDKIKASDPATVTTLIELVPELETRRATLATEAEQLQAEAQTQAVNLPSLMDELETVPERDSDRRHLVRLKVRQAIREHIEKVVIIDYMRQPANRITHPTTGKQYRPPAGVWLAVDVVTAAGDHSIAKLFLPSKSGDLYVVPEMTTRPIFGQGILDRIDHANMIEGDAVLRVAHG